MRVEGTSHSFRQLLLWCARLALLAYVFQVGAFDHWRPDPAHVIGVQGSALHTFHCHGDSAGCATSAGVAATLADVSLAPLPPTPLLAALAPSTTPVPAAFVSKLDEPPRPV